jgi:hypothetical protein
MEQVMTITHVVERRLPSVIQRVPPRISAFAATGNFISDLLVLIGLVFCLPFVILGIGLPLALLFRVLLWIGQLLQ